MSKYYKRSLWCFVLILCVILVAVMRVMMVVSDLKLSTAAAKQSTRTIQVAQNRGDIYDCNGILLTDRDFDEVTVVLPTSKASVPLSEMLSGSEYDAALKRVRQGQSVTVIGKKPITKGGWETFFAPKRYGSTLTHTLGYLDATGHGVSGVEKALDWLLYTDSYQSISYTADSLGRMLEGVDYTVDKGEKGGNVTLTVDSRIQSLCEQAMVDVQCGAAVIMEAKSGRIKAVVSQPQFDPSKVAEALTSQNSPLINRATYSYNVGSVFKPLLAAVTLEKGLHNYRYTCTGSITVGDKTFRCNKSAGHGELGLKEALAHSCNTYFYTLGEKLGAEAVYNMAKALRFGEALDCGGGLVSSSGSMPELETLQNLPAELVNLSIGQGELMLSPIALSSLYCAAVNGGEYRLPYLIESIEQNGIKTSYEPSLPTIAFSKATAEALKDYLKETLINGTGSAAFSEGVSAGGKTGTAQTGWVEDGRKILNGWFCGFYEGKEDYVIVILKEDVKSGSTDCAPIFKTLTEEMQNLGF